MSTNSATAVEDLDREELEDEVEDLRERVEELESSALNRSEGRIALHQLATALGVDTEPQDKMVDTAQAIGSVLADTIETHEQDLKRIDSTVQESRSATGSTDDEHWWNVVEAAHRLTDSHEHDLQGNWVRLYRENIAQATGLSKKRGQQLIDEWSDEDSAKYKRGAEKQPYQRGSAMNRHNEVRKALKIDLGVWEVDDDE